MDDMHIKPKEHESNGLIGLGSLMRYVVMAFGLWKIVELMQPLFS